MCTNFQIDEFKKIYHDQNLQPDDEWTDNQTRPIDQKNNAPRQGTKNMQCSITYPCMPVMAVKLSSIKTLCMIPSSL